MTHDLRLDQGNATQRKQQVKMLHLVISQSVEAFISPQV